MELIAHVDDVLAMGPIDQLAWFQGGLSSKSQNAGNAIGPDPGQERVSVYLGRTLMDKKRN